MAQKLGKLAKRVDRRTLRMSRYLGALAPPPPAWDLTRSVHNLGPMLNDSLGDCTCAAAGHMIQTWTAEAGAQLIPPDSAILQAYEGACGYVVGDPATDQGGVELNVLNYWRQTGIDGRRISAFAELSPPPAAANASRAAATFWSAFRRLLRSFFRPLDAPAPSPASDPPWIAEIKQAVYYFGGAYIGVQLPLTAQGQSAWDLVSTEGYGAPGSWGGHAIPIVAYDPNGVTVITWGALLRASWAFLGAYMDEAYALLSTDALGKAGRTPEGLDMAQLNADLTEITA